MRDVVGWVRKFAEAPTQSEHDPVAPWLDQLRGADPDTTLNQLSGWLAPAAQPDDVEPGERGAILGRVQEAGAAHVATLLAQFLSGPDSKRARRESTWRSLLQYQSHLTQALCASAEHLTKLAASGGRHRPDAAVSAARALEACRRLAKICLVHYASVPRNLWRLAYSTHAHAERAGCATIPVKLHADRHTVVTAEQELLRLLMLQVSAPDMMAPEHIEVADRAIELVSEQFTLRPPGVADNPFCYEPGGDAAPRRAAPGAATTPTAPRHFGPGMAFGALQRFAKQLASAKPDGLRVFGMDIPQGAQLTALDHLQLFWRPTSPYTPPPRSQASGELQVLHRYAQIWRQLSGTRRGTATLELAESAPAAQAAPEKWTLRDAGGNELGAEIPNSDGYWAKCGEIVSLSTQNNGDCWIGMIRRMQAEPGTSPRANIAVLSRRPQAVPLRPVREMGEDGVLSDSASRHFAFDEVRAIILSDGSPGTAPPNLLLPPDAWREGRVYEAQIGAAPRFVRGLQVVRRGDDYLRATFEWVPGPGDR
jgi:hypothetical protein